MDWDDRVERIIERIEKKVLLPTMSQAAGNVTLYKGMFLCFLFVGTIRTWNSSFMKDNISGASKSGDSNIDYLATVSKHDVNHSRDDLLVIDDSVRLRIEKVRDLCGDLCNTSKRGLNGLFFDEISAHVDCQSIFDDLMDAPREQRYAPKYLPLEFIDDFSMNGRVSLRRYARSNNVPLVEPKVFDQVYLGKVARTHVWTRALIEDMKNAAMAGSLKGNYGVQEAAALMRAVRRADVRNKHVLVIGSENPWVEAICLANGALHVSTLEYGKILSEHPDVTTILPLELNKQFREGTAPIYDTVVTFSSIEHSGLGRYGDALNPWGDIISIARAWCVASEEASLVIAVPWDSHEDAIEFNAHRVYSKVRYPYLTSNWRAISSENNTQKNFIFKKTHFK